MTTYIVLRLKQQVGEEKDVRYSVFERIGQREAHGALTALRKAGEQWGAGIYVAVPASNWSEERVGVETTTRITVGGASASAEPQE